MIARARPDVSATDRSILQLSALAEITRLVNASSDLGTMLDRIVFAICRYTQWDMSSIMSIDEPAGRTVLMARYDPHIVDVESAPRTWQLSTSPALQVMRTGKPLILSDAKNDTDYPFYRADAIARNYATVLITPLPARDMYGRAMVIAVQSKAQIEVDDEASEFLVTISNLAAIAVEKGRNLAEARAQSEHMRQIVDDAGVLMQQVLSESSATHVLQTIERLVGRPVLVTDHSAATVLAMDSTRSSPEFAAHLALVQERLALAVRRVGTDGRASDSARPFPHGHELPLEVDGEIVGHLYILGESTELAGLDMLLVQQVQFAASVLLMRSVVRFKSLAESQSKVLEELAQGGWHHEEDIRLRAASVGIQLGGPSHLGLVSVSMNDSARAALLAQNHRAVGFIVNHVFKNSAVVMVGPSELLVWISPAESSPELSKNDPSLRQLSSELARLLGESAFFCVSSRCVAVHDYAAAWSSCQRTRQLALRFARTGIVEEADFGPDAMILAALPHERVQKFQSESLDRVIAFDRRNGTDLLHTADSYLRSNCKLQRCADAMSIHVTTLRHRLERMRELFGIDFEDADQRFRLQLALRMRALAPR